ncbi:uncharacterized protein CEXT_532381 [Caerostris extrusa]|uniref:Uncharacterized protein n=1 Tax=Caerostris extrusa TaxID=172846 RepID=A0AAV4MWK1_CAEEX|nr:uncharacterized protein CEXT_532381 [Caerostris extrusa]
MVFPVNCCSIFQPVLTSMGLCYTMGNNREVMQLNKDTPIERPFIVDLLSPPHPAKGVEKGFDVFLTAPGDLTSVFEESEAQSIVPGFTTTISVRLMKVQRKALHTAWHGASNNCPTMPDGTGNKRYTRKMCTTFISSISHRYLCNCSSVLEPITRRIFTIWSCQPHTQPQPEGPAP